MKRILLALFLLLTLSGCQKEITTFDEVIKEGKVEIDGITYDIQSVRENSYEYDNEGNMIKVSSVYDNKEQHAEFTYDKGVLIEEKRLSFNKLDTILYYSYKEDKLIMTEYVLENRQSLISEYRYKEKTKETIQWNTDGKVAFKSMAEVDEHNQILSFINFDNEGNTTGNGINYYDENLLVGLVSENHIGVKTSIAYEYNNIGHKILSYMIHHGEAPIMIVSLYEYKYNDDMLPVTMTEYRVQSPISEVDIREYEQLK